MLLHIFLSVLVSASALVEFEHSFVFTSRDTKPQQNKEIAVTPGGKYVAYVSISYGAKSLDYFSNVFIVDDNGVYDRNNVLDISSLPSNGGMLSPYSLTLSGNSQYIKIHDKNLNGTKADPFVIYIVDTSASPDCDVAKAREWDGRILQESFNFKKCKSVTLLNADPTFMLSQLTYDGKSINAYVAPPDGISRDKLIFNSSSSVIASASRILVAGPIVSVNTDNGSKVSFKVFMGPSYIQPLNWGSSISVSSVGYCGQNTTYSHPYTEEITPRNIEMPAKAQGAFELTVYGKSKEYHGVSVVPIQGTGKVYSGPINDHFTAGGLGMTVNQIVWDPAVTRFYVQVTAL